MSSQSPSPSERPAPTLRRHRVRGPVPLGPPAIGLFVGALAASGASPAPLAWVAGLVVLALATALAGPRARTVGIGVGWLLLGFGRGAQEESPPPVQEGSLLFQVELADEALDRRTDRRSATAVAAWPAELRVDDAPSWRGRRSIELRAPAGGLPDAGPGAGLLVVGQLRADRRGLSLRPRGAVAVVSEGRGIGRFAALRRRVRERLRGGLGRIASPELRGLFVALVLGERTGIGAELRQAFSRTGTAHLLAISGLHVGTCWVGAAAVARRLLVFGPRPFVVGGWPGRVAPLLACVVAGLYVAVAGAPESGQRALGMTVLLAMTMAAARRPSPFNVLSGAVCAVVWWEPAAAASLGFQLSVASVAGLIACTPQGGNGVGATLRSVAATGLIGTFASAPLVGMVWGQVPLAGIWTNAVAVPLLGAATIPPLLVGAALTLITPALGAPFVWLASLPASVGLWLISALAVPSRAPNWAWQPSGLVVVLLYALSLCALLRWRTR